MRHTHDGFISHKKFHSEAAANDGGQRAPQEIHRKGRSPQDLSQGEREGSMNAVTRVGAIARFYSLCITLTYDGGALACWRDGRGQISTVIPWPVGARTDRPFTYDGPAVNDGGAA